MGYHTFVIEAKAHDDTEAVDELVAVLEERSDVWDVEATDIHGTLGELVDQRLEHSGPHIDDA